MEDSTTGTVKKSDVGILTPPNSEGLAQYRIPFCYELTGEVLNVHLDDGKNIVVNFLSGELVSLTTNAEAPEIHHYECLKSRSRIYLVQLELKGRWPREGLFMVLDLEKNLVTFNFLTQGAHKEYVKLVDRKVVFGAIKRPGLPLPEQRHEYSKDLMGKKIEYAYNPNARVVHIYYTDKLLRVAIPKGMVPPPGSDIFFEEPTIYLKIADQLYVMSWIEKNLGNGTQGFMLMDTKKEMDVGGFFGVSPQGDPENYMVSAFGKFTTEKYPEEDMPSPYGND
jgi:hypothetical protein